MGAVELAFAMCLAIMFAHAGILSVANLAESSILWLVGICYVLVQLMWIIVGAVAMFASYFFILVCLKNMLL